jgi:peptidoglycan hydrolase-like protein with peptidoglycan-binding domain
MAVGGAGVDVGELQSNLTAMGYSIGGDAAGVYGVGTAKAVAALYEHLGYPPVTAPVELRPAGKSRSGRRGSAVRTVKLATVPLGEIAFVSMLPTHVVSVARLGQLLGAGHALARLGSGRFTFSVKTDTNTASLLGPGATGVATSDLGGASFAVRVIAKGSATASDGTPEATLTVVPVDPAAAAGEVGQNMALHLRTGQSAGVKWMVPVSAVVTDAAGQSSVTVLRGRSQASIRVEAGRAFQGREVVRPIHGDLYVGEQVVTGNGG